VQINQKKRNLQTLLTTDFLNLKDIANVYFLGIGGIGMSALARWFHINGCLVAGYDRTPTSLTTQLQQEGISVHFEDGADHIPSPFKSNSPDTLIVYTPAVPKTHQEYNYFLNNGFNIKKRSQVLGLITQNTFTIAVAGTHGKTTTSSMIAHILKSAGKNVAAFLGGITQNYGTNLLLNDPKSTQQPLVVVEADEYDRSFLTLFPDIAVVNSVDADHLDIYGDHTSVQTSYNEFVNQIKPGGALYSKQGLPLQKPEDESVHVYDFSASANAAFRAENIHIANASFSFDFAGPDTKITGIILQIPGFHNVENATVAIGVALSTGVTAEEAKKGISSYKGVKRRFEYIIKNPYLVYIDDYAHHPAEIEAVLTSVRALYPAKKITAVFQPHLYSRTRDFAQGFSDSLSLADQVILLDIYPARELPIPGVSSQMLLDSITSARKTICSKDNLLEELNNSGLEVLITLGAGDIDALVQPIQENFKKKLAVNE
jgi:UDP-N-acetylmuramate--alanine ligase